MPRKRKPVSGAERRLGQSLLADIVAVDVMPPCSVCVSAGEKCRLRAGDCVCVRCTRMGKRCDLFLTLEDGKSFEVIIFSLSDFRSRIGFEEISPIIR